MASVQEETETYMAGYPFKNGVRDSARDTFKRDIERDAFHGGDETLQAIPSSVEWRHCGKSLQD